jgi:hypothetical protein
MIGSTLSRYLFRRYMVMIVQLLAAIVIIAYLVDFTEFARRAGAWPEYTIGKGIAYAWLPSELAAAGQDAEIGYFDRRVRATVTPEPLFDPKMTRLRG